MARAFAGVHVGAADAVRERAREADVRLGEHRVRRCIRKSRPRTHRASRRSRPRTTHQRLHRAVCSPSHTRATTKTYRPRTRRRSRATSRRKSMQAAASTATSSSSRERRRAALLLRQRARGAEHPRRSERRRRLRRVRGSRNADRAPARALGPAGRAAARRRPPGPALRHRARPGALRVQAGGRVVQPLCGRRPRGCGLRRPVSPIRSRSWSPASTEPRRIGPSPVVSGLSPTVAAPVRRCPCHRRTRPPSSRTGRWTRVLLPRLPRWTASSMHTGYLALAGDDCPAASRRATCVHADGPRAPGGGGRRQPR